MKSNPALAIEVTRGNSNQQHVESVHKIDIVIADAFGKAVETWGDADRSLFPRSAIKALQAIPLIESGAADAYAFEPKHLALACSSHNGEPFHTDAVHEMLTAAGIEDTCLECGAQLPYHPRDTQRLVKDGIPVTAVHNNCSGKHSGFLALAKHQGISTENYVKHGHPVQSQIAGVLETVTGAKHGSDNYGIDGCSIPTYEIPLQNLATAYAKLGAGEGSGKERTKAMTRLRDACMAHSEMVAGTGRFDTMLMSALDNRVFTKTGAEGVFTLAVPELGLGAALKCRDGTTRAAEVACAFVIESLLKANDSKLSDSQTTALKRLVNPDLLNHNKIKVGEVRVTH